MFLFFAQLCREVLFFLFWQYSNNWACRVKSIAVDKWLCCFLAIYAADEIYSVQCIFFKYLNLYSIFLHFYLNHSFWVRYYGREIWSRAITLDVKQLLNSFGALWDTITHFLLPQYYQKEFYHHHQYHNVLIALWKVMHLIPNLCTNSLQI